MGDRVWQMGAGALVILAGAAQAYVAAGGEPVHRPGMWAGLLLLFAGLIVPLATRAFEAAQEAAGAEGET